MNDHNQKPIKELVDKMLRAYGLDQKLDEMSLIKSWETVVGKMISRHTTDIFFRDKTLFIELDSAPLKQELSYAKSKLIDKINSEAGKTMIEDIVIR